MEITDGGKKGISFGVQNERGGKNTSRSGVRRETISRRLTGGIKG